MENTESRETKRGETKKLSIKTEKQTNWAPMEAHNKRKVVFKERRQKHLGTPSRS